MLLRDCIEHMRTKELCLCRYIIRECVRRSSLMPSKEPMTLSGSRLVGVNSCGLTGHWSMLSSINQSSQVLGGDFGRLACSLGWLLARLPARQLSLNISQCSCQVTRTRPRVGLVKIHACASKIALPGCLYSFTATPTFERTVLVS